MKRILKNINGKATIDTNYRGHRVVIKPKHSRTCTEKGEADYLLQTYGFLKEITPKKVFTIPSKIKKARGKK